MRLLIVIVLTSSAHADAPHSSYLEASASYSHMWRTTSASGFRVAAGFDHDVADAVTIGGRAGVASHEDAMGTGTLPYLGARAYFRTQLGASSQLRIGIGPELWVNSVDQTGIRGEPVFLHVLAELAPRIRLAQDWALDFPIELGVLPFFGPKVYTLQLGVQIARTL
jgi:hypothetical protein